jgi:hypothetical protein
MLLTLEAVGARRRAARDGGWADGRAVAAAGQHDVGFGRLLVVGSYMHGLVGMEKEGVMLLTVCDAPRRLRRAGEVTPGGLI